MTEKILANLEDLGLLGTAIGTAFTPAGNIGATNVQAAIEELDTEKLAAASYTAADVITKLKTVDGASSGIDADLLDGQDSEYYLKYGAGRINVLHLGLGIVGDGVHDDGPAIQTALDLNLPLFFPPGTYLQSLSQSRTVEGGSSFCSLKIRDGLNIQGVPKKTIFKLKSGESTSAAPKFYNMLVGNAAYDKVYIDGIVWDLNGTNNPVNKQQAATITIASPGVVTWASGTAPTAGSLVKITTTGTLPTGLFAGGVYYVKSPSGATSNLSLTVAGAAINTSGSQSGTHTIKTYSLNNGAAIMNSGSVATAGQDAYFTNTRITRCDFINGAGDSSILMGQSNTNSGGGGTGATLGKNNEVDHCYFYNNGLDAFDHSSIYGWTNGLNMHHCVFDHPTLSLGKDGPLCPAELHGSDNYFHHCRVNNYQQGPILSYNYTTPVRGQYVYDNNIRVLYRGVSIYKDISTTEAGMEDQIVARNRIEVLDGAFQVGATDREGYPKRAIDFVTVTGAPKGFVAINNTLICSDTVEAIGIALAALGFGSSITNLFILGNYIKGFPQGIYGGPFSALGLLNTAVIFGNLFTDINVSTNVSNTFAIAALGNTGFLALINNVIVGAVAGQPGFGLLVQTTSTGLHMSGNVATDGVGAFIVDTATVSGSRSGPQARGGIALRDTDSTHDLKLIPGSNLTANRTFTLVTGDANRSFTVASDVSISSFIAGLLDDANVGAAQDTLDVVPGTDVFKQRTITGTANRVTVSNGDGVSGNPTINLAFGAASTTTPTPAPAGGSMTATSSVRVAQVAEKHYHFRVRIDISNAGTGTGNMTVAMPLTASNTASGDSQLITGKEMLVVGGLCIGELPNNTSSLIVSLATGLTAIGTGNRILLTGIMEVA